MKLFTNLIALSLISLLVGCQSDKKPAIVYTSTVKVTGIGSVIFGKVPVGEYRVGGILLNNTTSSSQNINYPILSLPFAYHGATTTCSLSLASGESCVIGISFSPVSKGNFLQSIPMFDTNLTFMGQGSDQGQLTVVPAFWNIGNITAGNHTSQSFTITNSGDQRISTPIITNANDFSLSASNCDVEIAPSETCTMTLRFQRTVAGTFSEVPRFTSSTSIYFDVASTVQVLPSIPDGVILFDNVPSSIVSNGTDIRTINIVKVPDIFGNSVSNGTQCTLTGTNINFPDGNNIIINNGASLFRVQSTTTRGQSSVYVSCTQAFGLINFNSAADKAYGNITVASFNNVLRANGTSSVTIKTNIIRDIYGSQINNGDLIYFELSGSGSLSYSSIPSYNGTGYVTVTSGTSAGTAYLTIRANPIYTGSVITAWGASSAPIAIQYQSGYPDGNFNISCNRNSIYFQPTTDPYLTTRDSTICGVGPITDINGNLVGAGTIIPVNLLNGKNKSTGFTSFNITTTNDSIAYFELEGVGSRGAIQIEAILSGTAQYHTVFASGDEFRSYLPYGDSLKLYRGYGPAITSTSDSRIKPPGIVGSKVQRYRGDLNSLINADGDLLGIVSYSGPARTLNYNFPRLLGNDCIQNVGILTEILPCFYFLKSSGINYYGASSSYTIGYNNDLTILGLSSINTPIGSASAHGNYNTILSSNIYNPATDTYLIMGGIQYSGSSPYVVNSSNTLSKITYPSSFLTQFDQMTYSKSSLIHPGLYLQTSFSTVNGNSYVFGGVNSSGVPVNNLTVMKKNEDDTALVLEPITIAPNATYGSPKGLSMAGIYVDEDTNLLYVVGGLKRESGVWSFNNEIWSTTLSGPGSWVRICSPCSLPIPNITNFAQNALFPLATSSSVPTIFENLSDNTAYLRIQKDTEGRVLMAAENGGIYILNLVNGTTTQISDLNSYGYLSGSSNFTINQLSGRKFSFVRGSKTGSDSQVRFFETDRGTKPYYVTEIPLSSGAHDSAVIMNVKISGYGYAKDEGSSEQYGLSSYVYDFVNNEWVFIGIDNSNNDLDSIDGSVNFSLNEGNQLQNFISPDDKLYIMTTVSGSPGCFTSSACPLNGESLIRLNYIEVEGIW